VRCCELVDFAWELAVILHCFLRPDPMSPRHVKFLLQDVVVFPIAEERVKVEVLPRRDTSFDRRLVSMSAVPLFVFVVRQLQMRESLIKAELRCDVVAAVRPLHPGSGANTGGSAPW
jgi:hypothetical protein